MEMDSTIHGEEIEDLITLGTILGITLGTTRGIIHMDMVIMDSALITIGMEIAGIILGTTRGIMDGAMDGIIVFAMEILIIMVTTIIIIQITTIILQLPTSIMEEDMEALQLQVLKVKLEKPIEVEMVL